MKIAFAFELRRTDAEEEAEFCGPTDVEDIAVALTKAGHEVTQIDVRAPVFEWMRTLEKVAPDLIFNCCEGTKGRAREAFFPALFEALGIPYTGSDGHTMLLTLDKWLTKESLAPYNVPLARHALVTPENRAQGLARVRELRFPVIIKPNFEGSSKGITDDSVVTSPRDLESVLERVLLAYPTGVLIEEFIAGTDVAVAFLEGAPNGGILVPFAYDFDPEYRSRFNIYDYRLKNDDSEHVIIRCPAALSEPLMTRICEAASRIYQVLHVRDVGRIDFRIGEDGQPYFLEINPQPALTKGAGIFVAAERLGLSFDDTIAAIAANAARRYGLECRNVSL